MSTAVPSGQHPRPTVETPMSGLDPSHPSLLATPRHGGTAPTRILLRAIARLASWTIGLMAAAWVVPGVSVSASGVIFAVVFFSVAQTTLSFWILRLPHGWTPLLLGSTGLILTFVAMGLASVFTHGFSIAKAVSWIAATIVVWLVTTIGAILLPEVYVR